MATHNRTGLEGRLTPRKRRIFLLITLSIPFILIGSLEIVLRLTSYGPDLALFSVEQIRGKVCNVMNPGVKERYFTRLEFNPTTSPEYFSMPKPPGVYRIFCLGGSTTVGYPYYYNGSFSSFLRQRLRAVFPDKEFEIINLGMTATNSYTVNDMARELVNFEPDLLLVYDGHNEFYGALGIASNESLGSSRWLTTAYLRLIHWKSFLFLRDLIRKGAGLFRSEMKNVTPAGMMEKLARGQYIAYDSPTYWRGLESFRSNLEDLRDLASANGIPVILGTQVSNLRDQPPFISLNATASDFSRDSIISILLDDALRLYRTGKTDSALGLLHHGEGLEPHRADIHYLTARCLDMLGDKTAALREYLTARDYDQLRFRTSSDFNRAIRDAADGRFVLCGDMEMIFMEHSADSLIGNNLIVEHLHPNAKGFFLLAEGYARAMREHGLGGTREEWKRCDTIDTEFLWRQRPLSEIDERLAERRTEILTGGWPFTSHVAIVDPVDAKDTLGMIVEKVTRGQWSWRAMHEAAADYYLKRKELEKAAKEFEILIDQIPHDVTPYLRLARIRLDLGRFEKVRNILLRSLDIEKTILAYRALGDIAMKERDPAAAVTFYEQVFSFNQTKQELIENGFLLARAYANAGMTEKAKRRALQVLDLQPDYPPALNLLRQLHIPKP